MNLNVKIKRAQSRNSAILPTVSCFMTSGEVGQGCALWKLTTLARSRCAEGPPCACYFVMDYSGRRKKQPASSAAFRKSKRDITRMSFLHCRILLWIWSKTERIVSAAVGFVTIVCEIEKGHRSSGFVNSQQTDARNFVYHFLWKSRAQRGKFPFQKGHSLDEGVQILPTGGSNPPPRSKPAVCIYGNHPKIWPLKNR